MADLAQLIWQPIASHVEGSSRIVLSPDGPLCLVPWNALPIDRNRYLIEKYHLQYVTSGRDIVPSDHAAVKAGPAVIIADPDFDAGVARERRPAKDPTPVVVRLRGGRIDAWEDLPRQGRLRFSLTEGQDVHRLLDSPNRPALLHTGGEASEALTKLLQNPAMLILCTHAFFLDEQEETTKRINPLLRCALMLAGGNRRDEIGIDPENDGLLTGFEILGMDLRGTELVVLSACDTAVGHVHDGEGVAGLRQAFRLAGAKSVVATLWSVPDRATAQLMVAFFEKIAQGHDEAHALADAQRERIAVRRERIGAAHPFFWAAFTVSGSRTRGDVADIQ